MMTTANTIVKSHDTILDNEYLSWMQDIKQRFRNTQIKAAVKVNSEQLLFNWQLGRDLVERKAEEKWGSGIVEQLSLDLQAAFPGVKGFSTTNLWHMKQWYRFYAHSSNIDFLQQAVGEIDIDGSPAFNQIARSVHEDIVQQAVGEISFPPAFGYVPWGHHILIITKCKTVEEALFYIKHTIEHHLSRNALDNCIRADLYHTSGSAITNFDDCHSMPQGKLAHELLKGNYDLSFVSLQEEYDEKSLESAIEQRMTRFLLELGDGWAFVGRQKEIIIAGKSRKIDLLFYHIYLRCYVVLELKVKPFDPEYAGKLNFYVNAVNEFMRKDGDNPTIGLLICRELDRTEVQLAFQGITTPMGVATYDNVRINEIQKHLPTPDQIRQQILLAEEDYNLTLNESAESK